MNKVNKLIQIYSKPNMNREKLSYKVKDYYNLNESERLHFLYWI